MGREARVKRETPRGVVKGNELSFKHIRSNFVGQVNFSGRSYRVQQDGQLRRLSPDTGKER